MTITRHFLGWDAPVTDKVARFLLPAGMARPPDMSSDLIIVPTRQAGRRLREAMALSCARHETALLSARVETPAFFLHAAVEELPTATPTRVAAAWAAVLMRIEPEHFKGLFPASLPERDFGWALRTGSMLQGLRESLADGGLLIADVLQKFSAALEEYDRWRDMLALEELYLHELADRKVEDPCRAKIRAAHRAEPPQGVTRIVVAAVPDPSTLMISAIEGLARTVDVAVLIHAPESLADHFDEFGRPDGEQWKTAAIDIVRAKASILLAASPAAQSESVMNLVAGHAPDWGPADLAVGVPDASVIPSLTAAFEGIGLGAFDPSGRSPAQHPLFRIIENFRGLVANGDYESIAATLRHPDMLAFFVDRHGLSPAELMRELDEFQNEHLPFSFDTFDAFLRANESSALAKGIELLKQFRARLDGEALCPALRDVLQTIYGKRSIRHGDPADDEFVAVAGLVDDAVHEMQEALDDDTGLSAGQALDLMLGRLTGQLYYMEREDALVDLEGWLELPWNDAPLLVVTGMNDGIVPDSRMSDLFLPDSLRVSLGLRNDDSRFARDIYLMSSLVESRREHGQTYFVVGKTTQSGEPLKPSRVLFRCSDEELRERAQLLFAEVKQARGACPSTTSFQLRPFLPADVVERLSVTAFRSYLACPFRFYLQHVLRMEELDDGKTELDAMDFGSMVHRALEGMTGNPDIGTSADEKAVSGFLHSRAEAWVRERFGKRPPLQILIQLDAAKQRLDKAAQVHVGLVRDGWETIATESYRKVEMDGMTVSGIIDRVDRHEKSGRLRIIDYKTSDTGIAPGKSHLGRADEDTPDFAAVTVDGKKMKWRDLQLPLYRLLLAAGMDLPRDVEFGYFNLPRAIGETGLSLWDGFSEELQASAEACASDVISAVRANRFWPPAGRVEFDQYDRILLGDAEATVTGPEQEG